MAALVLSTVKCWLDKYDLSGDANAAGLVSSAELKVATVFGDTGQRRRAGLKAIGAHVEGFYNQGAGNVDDALFAAIGVANTPFSVALTGVEGERAYCFRALLGTYTPGAALGDLLAFSVTGEGSAGDALVAGSVLRSATLAVTGNGTGFQLGAVSATQKLYAALHVFGASGSSPTLDVLVQSNVDNTFGAPTTRVTFGQKTVAASEWATAVVGPITDTWYRVRAVIGGGSPSFTFAAVVGIL